MVLKSNKTASLKLVKQSNLTLVFNYINKNQPVSRATVAHATGLSPTTVSSLVDELIAENMVRETGRGNLSGSGRKPILIEVKEDGGCVAAVEMREGGFELELFDLGGKSVMYSHRETEDYAIVGSEISDEIKKKSAGFGRLLGICVGVPGVIDRKKKRVTSTVIPISRDNDFYDVIRENFADAKVTLGNESSFCAYIEKTESEKEIHSLVYIDINVGIGAGIILEDRIFTGAFGNAGEFGHVSVDINGKVCKCGNRGCIEAVAGIPAICESAKAKNLAGIDMSNPETQKKLSGICAYLASGINNVINMINPEAVIIGGEITVLGDGFLNLIKEELKTIRLPSESDAFELSFSSVQGNPVTRGAGRYMLDRIFSDGGFITE